MARNAGFALDDQSRRTESVSRGLLRRANPTIGLFLVCLLPAMFWTTTCLLVAHLNGFNLSFFALLALGASIAGFLTLVVGGLVRSRPDQRKNP